MIIDLTQSKFEHTLDWTIQNRDKFLQLKCLARSHVCDNRDISYFGLPNDLLVGFRCSCGMEWNIRVNAPVAQLLS